METPYWLDASSDPQDETPPAGQLAVWDKVPYSSTDINRLYDEWVQLHLTLNDFEVSFLNHTEPRGPLVEDVS